VSQHERRSTGLRKDDIEVTVVVEVTKSGAAANYRFQDGAASAGFGYQGEPRAVRRAGVPEQLRRLRIALALLDFADLFFQMAVDGEQVEPPIQVVVEKEHAEFQRQAACGPDSFRNRFVRVNKAGVILRHVKRG